jgi:hypothetical protein
MISDVFTRLLTQHKRPNAFEHGSEQNIRGRGGVLKAWPRGALKTKMCGLGLKDPILGLDPTALALRLALTSLSR